MTRSRIRTSGVATLLALLPFLPLSAWQAAPWLSASERALREFRCDLGGMRVSRALGPAARSQVPADYVFTPTYPTFDAAGRAEMRGAAKARGYTHFPVGPLWDSGYPGWSGHDFLDRPELFTSLLEELWRDRLIPVVWLMPNGPFNVGRVPDAPIDWAEVEARLTPIYKQKEWQALARVVVFGWEVDDHGWVGTTAESTKAAQWMERTFPTSFRYWHMTAGSGAACSRAQDPACAAKFWHAMAPHLTGSFWQDGSFGGSNLAAPRKPDNEQNRRDQFVENLTYEVRRLRGDHYRFGGLMGAHGPLDVIAGEYSAYFELNAGRTEAEAREYGALAMSVPGVRGFCDGGPGRR